MANNPKHMDNLRPIKKGEVRNPKGRPRKSINSTLVDLEARGIKKTNKEDILETYLRVMNMTMDELGSEVKDSNQTVLFRIVGKAVLSGKGFDIIEKMLDRSIGKVKQDIGFDLSQSTLNILNLGIGANPDETTDETK